MIYEFASAMAARGHEVQLYHGAFMESSVSKLDDITWYDFPPEIEHHFPPPGPVDPDTIPRSDVIFGFSTEGEMPAHLGLPVVLIQGYKMLPRETEMQAFHAPCPKVCVAGWLVDVALGLGVPREQLVHVPLGLRREKYGLRRPIEGRPPRISFCYSPHLQKCPEIAIDVLVRAKERVPELDAIVFGAGPLEHELPDWASYRMNPSQRELVDDIYNSSRIFLFTSRVEGFGYPAVEAMACGAALVTTDNGGSHDYAIHDETALVGPVDDPAPLLEHVVALLRDDAHRIEIAAAGQAYVRQFDWPRSAMLLEEFLEAYLADPDAYGRPVAAR